MKSVNSKDKSVSSQKLYTGQPRQEEWNQNFIAMDISWKHYQTTKSSHIGLISPGKSKPEF